MEIDLAADGGHAEGIAVIADAGDDARNQVAGLGVVRRAETQRIQRGDGARAHGEDVAQYAADAGSRALERLDEGGVVVALHLEDHGLAVADIDDASILARPLDDALTSRREGAQPFLRALVGTVLVPHRREDAKLGEGRFSPDQGEDLVVFFRLEAMFGDQFGGNLYGIGNHAAASSRLSNSGRPSVPPSSGSIRSSGWGIMPSTLPASLRMPAILLSEPLGLAAGVTLPSESQ